MLPLDEPLPEVPEPEALDAPPPVVEAPPVEPDVEPPLEPDVDVDAAVVDAPALVDVAVVKGALPWLQPSPRTSTLATANEDSHLDMVRSQWNCIVAA